MTEAQTDWKNAPEDATHWHDAISTWYKVTDGSVFIYSDYDDVRVFSPYEISDVKKGARNLKMSKYTSGKTTQKRDKCIQRKSSEISALKAEIDALKAQRDVAIQHIAEWCVVIEQNGSSWDDWGQYYKDACRDNALPEIRGALNAAIAKARSDELGVQS